MVPLSCCLTHASSKYAEGAEAQCTGLINSLIYVIHFLPLYTAWVIAIVCIVKDYVHSHCTIQQIHIYKVMCYWLCGSGKSINSGIA